MSSTATPTHRSSCDHSRLLKSTFSLPLTPMERPHKAHRTSQTGGKVDKKEKGKEKQHGFNEKVRGLYLYLCTSFFKFASRPLHRNQGDEPTNKADAMSR